MMLENIVGGILIGILLGTINISLLRLAVQRACRLARGWKPLALLISSYALRYLVIGLVIIGLLKMHKMLMALIALTILAALTILLAILPKKPGSARRSSAEAAPIAEAPTQSG